MPPRPNPDSPVGDAVVCGGMSVSVLAAVFTGGQKLLECVYRQDIGRIYPVAYSLTLNASGGLYEMLVAGQYAIAADWLDDHLGLVQAFRKRMLTDNNTYGMAIGLQTVQNLLAKVWRHGTLR